MHVIYFHSDIAGCSEYGLLARDGDFYQHPIKYPYTGSKTQFTVWVSFDGKTPAKIYNPNFLIELDFIANSEQSYDD